MAIFMDYCEGGSLADRLEQNGPLSLSESLDIAIQVCWAMEFAHEKGHIHRDLKPGNVLLDGDGKAMVSDFGLVKMLEAEELKATCGKGGASVGLEQSLREVGGTPAYMPPEQWDGCATQQSDIYAFGVMLYELLCGRLPFTAANPADLRRAHETVPPPDPKKWNAEIPDELAELMQSCLGKQARNRPKDFDKAAKVLSNAYRKVTDHAYTTHRQKPKTAEISRVDKQSRAWALIRLGAGCKLRGDLRDTDRNWRKALSLFEELSDKLGMGTCYNNMGLVAAARGDYDGAMELYEKSLTIRKKLGDKSCMGGCYNNMAALAQKTGDHVGIRNYSRKAVRVFDDIGVPVHPALRQAAGL